MGAPKHKRGYARRQDDVIGIAKEHIDSLFKQAAAVAGKDLKKADRYVSLARKIAMKFKIHLPSSQKRLFCRHCYSFLLPGKNLRVRVHEHRVIYLCGVCKKFWRRPLKSS